MITFSIIVLKVYKRLHIFGRGFCRWTSEQFVKQRLEQVHGGDRRTASNLQHCLAVNVLVTRSVSLLVQAILRIRHKCSSASSRRPFRAITLTYNQIQAGFPSLHTTLVHPFDEV